MRIAVSVAWKADAQEVDASTKIADTTVNHTFWDMLIHGKLELNGAPRRFPVGNALEENGSVKLGSAKGTARTTVLARNCFAPRSLLREYPSSAKGTARTTVLARNCFAPRSALREYLGRTLLWILQGIAAALPLFAQAGSPDPLFATIPFDRWLADRGEAQIRWTTRIPAVELSIHQRLRARVEIQVDGSELVKRRGHGQLVMLAQLTDSENRVYQTHTGIELRDVEEAAAKSNIVYVQDFFVLPGEYRVALAVFDTMTREYSATQRTLHAGALKGDPLPEAWHDLPPVETVRDSPGDPFLPALGGRLHLPLATHRPIRIEVLVIASRSAATAGPRSGKLNNSSLGELIPALQTISQVEVRNGALNVAFLDLTRRQVIFEQDSVRDVDWAKLRTALSAADPNVIDVHELENRKQNAQFFLSQVSRRIAVETSSAPLPVLIVLSGPIELSSGEDLRPIQAGRTPGSKIFYIRYHSMLPRPVPPSNPFDRPVRGRRSVPLAPPSPAPTEPLDSLEGTLKPLQPRLFDVTTPEQFRKALGALLDEISRI